MELLLATNNKNKVIEIQKILDCLTGGEIQLKLAADVYQHKIEVEENGATLEENALLKAKAFYEYCKIPTISDDTSLEIEALNGEPGIYAARYSGVHGSDEANRQKVLKKLGSTPEGKRMARFRTVICYFDGISANYVDGKCCGKNTFTERGSSGFGYDPIFIPNGYDITFAEMPPEKKNLISHRFKAVENLVILLTQISH